MNKKIVKKENHEVKYKVATVNDLPILANRAGRLLVSLAQGNHAIIQGQPYPIAMGEDGSVGWLYNDHIPTEFTVSQLLKLMRDFQQI